MEEGSRKTIEEIIARTSCPKDFRCYRENLSRLCKAKDIGLESFLECLEDDPEDCKFSIRFGYGHFCKCPVRVYIAKKLSE
jgi:hypothetical protein